MEVQQLSVILEGRPQNTNLQLQLHVCIGVAKMSEYLHVINVG